MESRKLFEYSYWSRCQKCCCITSQFLQSYQLIFCYRSFISRVSEESPGLTMNKGKIALQLLKNCGRITSKKPSILISRLWCYCFCFVRKGRRIRERASEAFLYFLCKMMLSQIYFLLLAGSSRKRDGPPVSTWSLSGSSILDLPYFSLKWLFLFSFFSLSLALIFLFLFLYHISQIILLNRLSSQVMFALFSDSRRRFIICLDHEN